MRYTIQQRMRTLASLWEPFEFRGFKFENWHFDVANGPRGDAWIATKTIEANNIIEAITTFREELLPIADRIAFVSQCFMTVEPESFLVQKSGDSRFFIRFTNEVPAVGLHFGAAEVASLRSLEAYPEKGNVFGLLRESANASTYITRLSLLAATLEAIASFSKGLIGSDKGFIKKKILQDDGLYEELFKYGTGIRHRILHGTQFQLVSARNYVAQIYGKIIGFFNKRYGTQLNEFVRDPQRHFFGNYEALNLWLEITEPTFDVSLKVLCDFYREARKRNYNGDPDGVRSIEAPQEY
jgi:hypothetical protein